ncbi:hypothetical protein HYW55_06235 [Candidatus Gottesmanbacteria bacterium]|nr:hypothetical protein [Candidatus Gottesmanbacteria bacterium]
MNPAPTNSQQTQSTQLPKGTASSSPTVHPGGKERTPQTLKPPDSVSEVSQEVELPKDVERVGVVKFSEKVEIPPDVAKLGVTQSGPATPVQTTSQASQVVVLPITDEQVISGLHAQVTSALKWLSVWCLKQLQRAHITLKVIHGKIMRVSSG